MTGNIFIDTNIFISILLLWQQPLNQIAKYYIQRI
jgi:hypothetical protein